MNQDHDSDATIVAYLQDILAQPEEVTSMSGMKLPLKCSVDYISFSAHVDYRQVSEFVRALQPPHLVRQFQFLLRIFMYFTRNGVVFTRAIRRFLSTLENRFES